MTTIAEITTATPNGPTTGVELVAAPIALHVTGVFDGARILVEAGIADDDYAPLTGADGQPLAIHGPGRYTLSLLDGDYARVQLQSRGAATAILVQGVGTAV